MIQLQGAGKRFGHKLLFENFDWLITPKERTGLVGANGTGKSTLLKILCGSKRSTTASSAFPRTSASAIFLKTASRSPDVPFSPSA
jgi:ATPase subunit of ABC transporter with duplicated ATPase domains